MMFINGFAANELQKLAKTLRSDVLRCEKVIFVKMTRSKLSLFLHDYIDQQKNISASQNSAFVV